MRRGGYLRPTGRPAGWRAGPSSTGGAQKEIRGPNKWAADPPPGVKHPEKSGTEGKKQKEKEKGVDGRWGVEGENKPAGPIAANWMAWGGGGGAG